MYDDQYGTIFNPGVRIYKNNHVLSTVNEFSPWDGLWIPRTLCFSEIIPAGQPVTYRIQAIIRRDQGYYSSFEANGLVVVEYRKR